MVISQNRFDGETKILNMQKLKYSLTLFCLGVKRGLSRQEKKGHTLSVFNDGMLRRMFGSKGMK
jgi:hypothetical protein